MAYNFLTIAIDGLGDAGSQRANVKNVKISTIVMIWQFTFFKLISV